VGLAIRNAFEFWNSKSPWLNFCKPRHSDDMSDPIIYELWQTLNQTSEYFIDLLVQYRTENGVMEPERLYESPFT